MIDKFACVSQAIVIWYITSYIASFVQTWCMNSKSLVCGVSDMIICAACLIAVYMVCDK